MSVDVFTTQAVAADAVGQYVLSDDVALTGSLVAIHVEITTPANIDALSRDARLIVSLAGNPFDADIDAAELAGAVDGQAVCPIARTASLSRVYRSCVFVATSLESAVYVSVPEALGVAVTVSVKIEVLN